MSRILSVRNADFNCLFYLRKEVLLENGHHPIYVKLKFSRIGHVRKSTGYSCRPEDWIHESQRVRSQIRGGMELNANLVKFAKKALEAHHQIMDMDVTPPIAVVDQLLFGKQPTAKQKKLHESLLTFPEFVEWFFDNAEARLSENSIKAYKSGFQHLYAYAKSKGKEPGFRLFDRFFGDQFVRYLANKRISNNTSGKYLTALKIVLREAVRVGIQVTNDFESYKIPSAPVDFVYLTSEELEKLMHADLSHDRVLEHARNTFVFQCGCGLRFSDIATLEWEHIVGDNIELVTHKTKQYLRIPLNRFTREILERNKEMPKPVMVYANASQNRMLKKIGKEIGLTERKVTTKYYGNQREDSIVSKWQLVGTHTARRTFITLALERGMRPEVVMKITGHKKLSTMQLYISITNNVMQEEMAQAFG